MFFVGVAARLDFLLDSESSGCDSSVDSSASSSTTLCCSGIRLNLRVVVYRIIIYLDRKCTDVSSDDGCPKIIRSSSSSIASNSFKVVGDNIFTPTPGAAMAAENLSGNVREFCFKWCVLKFPSNDFEMTI